MNNSKTDICVGQGIQPRLHFLKKTTISGMLRADRYPVILYYKYVEIPDPAQLADAQRNLCRSLGLKGRILVATEGINGTLAGPVGAIKDYVGTLRNDGRFADVELKVPAGDVDTFPKLSVRVRLEIVALNYKAPLRADQNNHLSPREWKRAIEEDADVVLLDVRNNYETAAGRFVNAIDCGIDHFRELPKRLSDLANLKEKKILMYCTGGIRCEKASALLRSQGFAHVFQLHGGIMNYQKEYGNKHWLGECFVFDQRMTVKVEEGLVRVGQCAHTGRRSARFVNCLHDPCHSLFILAEETELEHPDSRLCPGCLGIGLTVATAKYRR
jgi:UPF0176 protein